MLISGQPPFTMLVANLASGSDPSRGRSGNPVKIRKSFTFQHFPEIGGRGPDTTPQSPEAPGSGTRWGHVEYTAANTPVRATGVITVASNDFSGPTVVTLGQYALTSGDDFLVGEDADATAANLGLAIDNLAGYSTAVAGNIVTVTGLAGPIGNDVLFAATGSSSSNFAFIPTNRRMAGAEPRIGPPILG